MVEHHDYRSHIAPSFKHTEHIAWQDAILQEGPQWLIITPFIVKRVLRVLRLPRLLSGHSLFALRILFSSAVVDC